MASMAIRTLPSVPFLNPTGQDRPEASSRWTWLSVVRAPMAPQLIRSFTYCGVIRSRYSVAAGIPISLMSTSRWRARRKPLLMRKVWSRSGSLMSPFQPTVVRGFSKYTRMTTYRASASLSRSGSSRPAYSRAALTSWIEQGPTTTSSRSSCPRRISRMTWRASKVVRSAASEPGYSACTSAGVLTASIDAMRTSSVR